MIIPRSVWSVWEMLDKYAYLFSFALVRLDGFQSICLRSATGDDNSNPEVRKLIADGSKDVIEDLRRAIVETEMLNVLPELDRLSDEFKALITNRYVGLGTLVHSITHLRSRVLDELKHKYLLLLSESNRTLYQATEPLGADFKNKFSSAGFDVDEAVKCLALGRYTASVFHLMRVMERALHAVHACLGITTPPKDNWGQALKDIRENYRPRPHFSEMGLFQELYALLDAVKDAWRNPTIHPANKYTELEAQMIFQTVRNFLMKLAARMDEDGQPLA